MSRKADPPLKPESFNPLERRTIAQNVAERLLRQEPIPLTSLPPFIGAGIYAIYYFGDFPAYSRLAATHSLDSAQQIPIYVGMAVPEGSRKGMALSGADKTKKLFERIKQHAATIDNCSNLDLAHFYCRYLVVDDIWIPLGESVLIEMFAPLWNQYLDGFGNKNPGVKRVAGALPLWHTVHPGGPWAGRHAPNPKSAEVILGEIEAYLATQFARIAERSRDSNR